MHRLILAKDIGLADGLLVFILGLLVIILVLLLLVGFLYSIKHLNALIDKSGSLLSRKKQPKNSEVRVEETQEDAVIESYEAVDDEELIAAITAAVFCMYDSNAIEDVKLPFRIKNVRRIK